MNTSSQAATSLSLSSLNFCSSWNSSIMVSIKFMCDFTMLLSVVGDNSYKAHIHKNTHWSCIQEVFLLKVSLFLH